jgi:hypothetical protein
MSLVSRALGITSAQASAGQLERQDGGDARHTGNSTAGSGGGATVLPGAIHGSSRDGSCGRGGASNVAPNARAGDHCWALGRQAIGVGP